MPLLSQAARNLVDRYERSRSDEHRRSTGVHYTPPAVARLVVEEAIRSLGRVPETICDPTCGAGSFLLAAADALFDAGVPADEIVQRRLVGGDVDPGATRTAREALDLWAEEHGAQPTGGLQVTSGDTLLLPAAQWPGRPARGLDLVVGNPPFLGQLSRRTARGATERRRVAQRFGGAAGYADSAALFLLGALDLVSPGGVVSMLQPQSFLAGRHTEQVRRQLAELAELVTLWASDDRLFDASVRVCAPVLRRRHGSSAVGEVQGAAAPVRLLWDVPAHELGAAPMPPASSWGPLLATAHGIPQVRLEDRARLGRLASATAGFRDEYYALRDAVVDGGAEANGRGSDEHPPLLSVGMVEPGWTSWAERARRLGGQQRLAPRVDLAALAQQSPRVHRWALARRVPKVLVATQTKVIEVAPDPSGECIPLTPLISVEPHGDPSQVWALAAALLAPPVSAEVVAQHLGTGLSSAALRWSASAVLEVPLPVDETSWVRGAELCRQLADAPAADRPGLLDRIGTVMCRAHGLPDDHPSMTWWRERVRTA